MTEHKLLSPCPFCGEKLFLDIDEGGGVAILHSLKEKDCFFPSILEIEMPVGTTLEQMIEKINRRPIQESFEHAIAEIEELGAQEADCSISNRELLILSVELARRTASLHYANTVCMEQKHVIDRLKEDAERLASNYVIEAFPHEWVCRGGCHHWARFGEQIDHAPDCPITLHRALMKELE